MIINIPLNFDEKAIEEKVGEQVQDEFEKRVKELVHDAIENRYGWHTSDREGMSSIVRDVVREEISKEFKDQIMNDAAERLAKNLGNTKKAKAIKKVVQDE